MSGQPVEPASVERRAVALVQDRAVERLDHGVVVGRSRRDPLVTDPELGAGARQRVSSELGTVSLSTPR